MTDKRQLRNRKRDRKRDLPKEIIRYVHEGFYAEKGPTEIFNELMATYPLKKWEKKFPHCPLPGNLLRTIQRMCADLKAKDSSAIWQLSNEDFTPDQAQCVLRVLQCVIWRTDGRKRTFTNNEARWTARIGQTVPSLCQPERLWLLWVLARLYLLHDSQERPTAALDSYMAFEPWSDDGHRNRYTDAVEYGWVSAVPLPAELIMNPEVMGKLLGSIQFPEQSN